MPQSRKQWHEIDSYRTDWVKAEMGIKENSLLRKRVREKNGSIKRLFHKERHNRLEIFLFPLQLICTGGKIKETERFRLMTIQRRLKGRYRLKRKRAVTF